MPGQDLLCLGEQVSEVTDPKKLISSLLQILISQKAFLEGDQGLDPQAVYKSQVDLEFSVDRLLDFLNKYTAFISQGQKYYQKFHIIVTNYDNEVHCSAQLPRQFARHYPQPQ